MRLRPLPHLPGLLLALLSVAAWAAETAVPSGPSLRFRRVSLTAKPEVVRLAPGIPATLNFADAELNSQKVRLDATARVKFLTIAERSVTLVAEGDLGEGVTLRVAFVNEPALAEPAFQLITDADVADGQVMVFRSANAPELMQARVTELEARSVLTRTLVEGARPEFEPAG